VVFTIRKVEEKLFIFCESKNLFMDDKKDIRNMIGQMLTHLGYEVGFVSVVPRQLKCIKMQKRKDSPLMSLF